MEQTSPNSTDTGEKGNVPGQAALEAEISAEPKPEQITGVTLGILFQLVF